MSTTTDNTTETDTSEETDEEPDERSASYVHDYPSRARQRSISHTF